MFFFVIACLELKLYVCENTLSVNIQSLSSIQGLGSEFKFSSEFRVHEIKLRFSEFQSLEFKLRFNVKLS